MHVFCLDRGHTRDWQRMEKWIERKNKESLRVKAAAATAQRQCDEVRCRRRRRRLAFPLPRLPSSCPSPSPHPPTPPHRDPPGQLFSTLSHPAFLQAWSGRSILELLLALRGAAGPVPLALGARWHRHGVPFRASRALVAGNTNTF
jgi:hypothetical protein